MTSLNRKLLRDLMGLKGQMLAISLVMACGVATFVMSLTTLASLERSQERYYRQHRFADVFAPLTRAPSGLVSRIEEIEGVGQVQTRVVADVTLDMPEMAEPARGRLISLPDAGRPVLNVPYLRMGRWIEPGERNEVLVSEAFAEAHGLLPGDSVVAVINERLETLRIVGIALSPEYVLSMGGEDFLPDDRRFGVFWQAQRELAPAFDMEGAFNDVSLTLLPGARQEAVIDRLDELTRAYGGVGAYGRSDQLSHRFLADELRGLRGMGMVVPIVFLGVAAFLLNVVMSRLIGTQREQVAAMKALGYSKLEVGWHYVKFVLVIAVAGSSLGIAAGMWLASAMTGLYTRFYRFPEVDVSLEPLVIAGGLLAAGGGAVLGTLGAVRRAVALPPAEAMRPEAPPTYRPTVIEQLGLQRLFAQPARMVLRHLERRPIKAGLSVLGISMGVAILVMGSFLTDALNHMIEFGFYVQQRQDVTITFTEPTSASAIHAARRLPGVIDAQPIRTVPVRLTSGHQSRRGAITGIEQNPRLLRVIDTEMRPVELPPDGLVMTDMLARLLEVEPGDLVTVELMEGDRRVIEIPLARTVREYSGMNAYMRLDALHRVLREDATLNGAHLLVDAREMENLFEQVKRTPRVAGVSAKEAMVRSFQETTAENQRTIQFFNMIFATIIAVGVVYNTARISLSERGRELATLRVIGFTRGEISRILLGELAVLTLLALPVGMVLGWFFSGLVALAFESESYRIPLVITRQTYGTAGLMVVLAAVASGLAVRRRLDHLDLVSVLKAKE